MKRLLLAAVLLTAACGSSEPTVHLTDSPAPTPSATTKKPTPTKPTTPPPVAQRTTEAPDPVEPPPTEPSKVSEPPSTILPDDLQEYMLRLEGIDPVLSSSERLAIARGNAVCDDVRTGASYQDLISYTRQQFSTADHRIDQETAQAVYEVVRSGICPT